MNLIMVDDLNFEKYFSNFIENWVNCWNGEIPNQQLSYAGHIGSIESSETRETSPNSNSLHERPTSIQK